MALANLQLGDNLAQLQDDLSQDEEPSNFQVIHFDCSPILFHCRKGVGMSSLLYLINLWSLLPLSMATKMSR
jgi:hypothetical protein